MKLIWMIYTKVIMITTLLNAQRSDSTTNIELTRQLIAYLIPPATEPRMLSSKEAAAFINKDLKTLYNNRVSGMLKGEKIGGRWYYAEEELSKL